VVEIAEGCSGTLAGVLRKKGEYNRALVLLKKVLDASEKSNALGPEYPSTLRNRSDVATLLEIMGKYEECLREHQLVLQKQEICLGRNHHDTVETVLGDYDEAILLYEQVYSSTELQTPTRRKPSLNLDAVQGLGESQNNLATTMKL
jgi:tetratricopeptide (TPR) repeat protein